MERLLISAAKKCISNLNENKNIKNLFGLQMAVNRREGMALNEPRWFTYGRAGPVLSLSLCMRVKPKFEVMSKCA
jgi:hypothetical protein